MKHHDRATVVRNRAAVEAARDSGAVAASPTTMAMLAIAASRLSGRTA
jgi:hypothetical protein